MFFCVWEVIVIQNEQCSRHSRAGFSKVAERRSWFARALRVLRSYTNRRFLRYRFSPWFVLVIAPLKLCISSEVQRTHEKILWMRAIGKINFVDVYALLNDLLW